MKNLLLNVATAFSGMGAAEYVLKRMNINHNLIFAAENDKFCIETLKRNYVHQHIYGDVKEINGKDYKYIDLFIWGSPCQDFSLSGTTIKGGRKGLQGERGKLFLEGLKLTKELNAKYVIIENVVGLKTMNNGDDFKVILDEIKKLDNYNYHIEVINSAKIGGNCYRNRLFIVLIRKDIKSPYIKINKEYKKGSIKECLIHYKDYEYISPKNYKIYVNSSKSAITRKLYVNNIIKRNEDRYVYDINYPSPTIQRKQNIKIHDGIGIRKLSVLEMKRILGFSDDLDLSHLSKTQILNQLGNTIEVTAIRKVIKQVLHTHNQEIKLDKCSANNTEYKFLDIKDA